MKTKYLLIVLIFGISLHSCSKTEIVLPEAEITEIYDITDTSAIFTVNVTSESNAQLDEAFIILIDSLPITTTSYPRFPVFIAPAAKIGLHTIFVPGLVSNTHYFARLCYYGVFEGGTPDEPKGFFVGEEKEFTTLS